MSSELPPEINIFETKFSVEFLENEYGQLHYQIV